MHGQSVSVSFSLFQSVDWQADYKTDWNRREAQPGKQRLDPGKIDFSQLSSDIHDQLTEISILFWLYRIAISSWNRISVSFYVSALGKWLKRQLLPYLNASSHGFVASIWESFSQLPLIINPKLFWDAAASVEANAETKVEAKMVCDRNIILLGK